MTKQTQTQTQTQASKASAQNSTPVAPRALAYCMLQGFRPAAGAALFAHTAAFLALTGMDAGKRIPRATVVKALGETAVKHHLTRTGFFAQYPDGVTVSDMGVDAFKLRTIDPELFAGFSDILATGKTSRNMPQTFTNPNGIKAI